MADAVSAFHPFTDDEVERSVPERFARVAAACPTALAVAGGPVRLTYADLDRASARVAGALAGRTAAGAPPVAVLADDPIARIVAMLGVWKAGRVSVAIDPADPEPRVAAILRDAGVEVILADEHARADLGLPVLRVHELVTRALATGDLVTPDLATPELDRQETGSGVAGAVSPAPIPAGRACALVYTSGSTGAPKGVVRSHRNQLHRARSMIQSLGIRPGDRVSALHAPSSAVGLRDVVAALLAGATALPFDVRRAGLGALARWIDAEAVSVLCASATTFRHLMASVEPDRRFASVRAVRLGSEPAYRQDVEAFRRHFPRDGLLVTGYGASEANGICEYRIGPDTPLPAARVPAGFPIASVQILVVDDAGAPVPVGETGEIVVRSRFLAEGYWRQPDLTATAFAGEAAGAELRLYRTGDIGRLGPDGCLAVLGRRDEQVKVRGYRVHPGEVEAALREHAGVRDAIVLGRHEARDETELAAYVVAEPQGAVDAVALRRFLRTRLPAHMVPVAFVALEALPVLPSGKVDRAALPAPPAALGARETAYTTPHSPLEHHIAEIWERLFDERPIGADHDFFDLGGNSLVAAAFVTELEDACGRAVSPSLLVEYPTVAGLADALVREEAAARRMVIPLRETGGRAPLFFLHGDRKGGGLYCHGLARRLDPERPFYAVHPHGLAGGPVPPTIEAMAADLLPAIRAARPRGPYALAGHCNGAFVALELARRLRAEGERVERVVLVEAKAPRGLLRVLHRTSAAAERLGLPARLRARLVARGEIETEELDLRVRYYGGRAAAFLRAPLPAKAEAIGRFLGRGARRLAEARRAGPGGGAAPSAGPLLGRREGSDEAYHRVIRRYDPPAYPGRVDVIIALDGVSRGAALGWEAVLPHVAVTAVPGDHVTCVSRHVEAFAEALDRALATG